MLFYYELGKGNCMRVYGIIPDLIIILGGLKYLVGLAITPFFVVTFLLTAFFLLTLLGLFFSKSGLYAVDQYTKADRDPVMRELLSAARKVNK